MTTVYDILDQLASDNSRLAKEAILTTNKNNADLQEAFRIALDQLLYSQNSSIHQTSQRQKIFNLGNARTT
jgi:hypothetical protein